MRKLTAGNKSRFSIFTLIIIVIIIILITFLNKMHNLEKEQYEISKDVFIYDSNYERVELTKDAVISKKWTGKYYLSEPETGKSYELGTSAILYDIIKNRLNLFGNFYEVSLHGEVNILNKKTELLDMLNSKIYKIEDRKYLVVSPNIAVENSSIVANNYLIVVIDKAGNTLLLNNEMDVKTINALVLQTDTFKFDVANEKLLVNDNKIDLAKIIGTTNEYVPIEEKESKESNDNNKEVAQNGGTTVNVGGSTSNSFNSSNAQVGDTINNNSNNNNQNNSNKEESKPITNLTKIVKSINLRSVSVGPTYFDVNYFISDPESKYQIVYLYITGENYSNTIALDKTKEICRIQDLKPNTEYKITLGYKTTNINNKVENSTEDIINVRTLKPQEELNITKITANKIYYNLKLDNNYIYDSAKINVYIDGVKDNELSQNIDIQKAISGNGLSAIINEKPEGSILTLKLENVIYKGIALKTDLQATIKL